MRFVAGIVLLIAACATEPPPPEAPHVVLYLDPLLAEHREIVVGAERWEELGFRVTVGDAAPTRPVCDRYWYAKRDLDCEIAITVGADLDASEPAWGVAFREWREIRIREDIRGNLRARVAAHEIGHVLLNTGDHLEPSQGTMANDGSDPGRITHADRTMARRTIGWPFDGRPPLEARGELGDLCEQAGWQGVCGAGLECLAAPEGRLDRVCSRLCKADDECGSDAVCHAGVCVERCAEREDWPWPCPWGEERVVDDTCVCVPGRRGELGVDL